MMESYIHCYNTRRVQRSLAARLPLTAYIADSGRSAAAIHENIFLPSP